MHIYLSYKKINYISVNVLHNHVRVGGKGETCGRNGLVEIYLEYGVDKSSKVVYKM